MDDQQLGVAFDAPRLAARHAREAGGILAGRLSAHQPASNHHPGWAANDALNELTSAWSTHLDGHVEESHDVAHRYHRTGGTYSTAEYIGERATRDIPMPPIENV